MNKIYLSFWIILIILSPIQLVFSQRSDSLSGSNIVLELREAYNDFDNQRTAELLNAAFNSLDQISIKDQEEIYKYAAFIAFQNGNNTLTATHFWSLLEMNPNYVLDPVTTSPKLVTLFQKTKIEFLEDMNRRLELIQQSKTERDIPWRALILPGWEQWHRGYRTKGSVLLSAGIVSIGGLVYSMIMTHQKRKDYLASGNSEEIARMYDEYNTYYQRQYYFSYAFVSLWSISQIDLALWSGSTLTLNAIIPSEEVYPFITLKLQW